MKSTIVTISPRVVQGVLYVLNVFTLKQAEDNFSFWLKAATHYSLQNT